MEKQLDFYEVNAEYITYLMSFDAKVPYVDYTAEGGHDKFLCGVVLFVNGHDYFAPISSFNIQQRTNMIIKNEQSKAVSSIRFSFMIPVPPDAIVVKIIKSFNPCAREGRDREEKEHIVITCFCYEATASLNCG